MFKYKIIVNPTAGRGKAAKHIPKLKELLAQAKLEYDLVLTAGPGHGTELARKAVEEGWPAIAVVGGDGTVNEIIPGLVGSSTPLAVIPAGTGNDLARSLGLPTTLSGAVDILVKPKRITMDLGQDQENYFACICGIGFPADVMYNVNQSKDVFSGSTAFAWGIIKTLQHLQAIQVELQLDGVVKQAQVQGVFILNTVYAGGGIKFSPHADPCDGKLDVLIMQDMSIREVLTVLPRVYRGTHLAHPKVDFYRVNEVLIQTARPVKKMFDGNLSAETPIRAKVSEDKLCVLTSG